MLGSSSLDAAAEEPLPHRPQNRYPKFSVMINRFARPQRPASGLTGSSPGVRWRSNPALADTDFDLCEDRCSSSPSGLTGIRRRLHISAIHGADKSISPFFLNLYVRDVILASLPLERSKSSFCASVCRNRNE